MDDPSFKKRTGIIYYFMDAPSFKKRTGIIYYFRYILWMLHLLRKGQDLDIF